MVRRRSADSSVGSALVNGVRSPLRSRADLDPPLERRTDDETGLALRKAD